MEGLLTMTFSWNCIISVEQHRQMSLLQFKGKSHLQATEIELFTLFNCNPDKSVKASLQLPTAYFRGKLNQPNYAKVSIYIMKTLLGISHPKMSSSSGSISGFLVINGNVFALLNSVYIIDSMGPGRGGRLACPIDGIFSPLLRLEQVNA